MKKIINLFALALVAMSVVACSNPSDSIGYYPTTVQTAPQETNNGGQEQQSENPNGESKENPNNGDNQNDEEEQQNENPSNDDNIIAFIPNKYNKKDFFQYCSACRLSEASYSITYDEQTYIIEYFNFNGKMISLKDTYTEKWNTSDGYRYMFNSELKDGCILKIGILGFTVHMVYEGDYFVGLDTVNKTLVINQQ